MLKILGILYLLGVFELLVMMRHWSKKQKLGSSGVLGVMSLVVVIIFYPIFILLGAWMLRDPFNEEEAK